MKKHFLLLSIPVLFMSGCIYKDYSQTGLSTITFLEQHNDMMQMVARMEINNGRVYADFEQQRLLYRHSFERIEKYYNQAQKLRKLSDSLNNEVAELKHLLIEEVREKKTSKNDIPFDNIDRWSRTQITADFFKTHSGDSRASQLKNKLIDYRKKLLSEEFLLNSRDSFIINLDLLVQSPSHIDWEEYYFDDRSAASALYELSRIQFKIKQSEFSLLAYLYSKISASSYKFDAINAQIKPKNNQVKLGQKFEASIFFSAHNVSDNPLIIVNEKEIENFENGAGLYSEKAERLGLKKVKGHIKICDPLTGESKKLPFETEYEVVP